jgi:hypothetical protein
MTRTSARQRAEALAADATMTFRWDGVRKRWEVTLTHRQLGVLGVQTVATTVALDQEVGRLLLNDVRASLERLLPF